MPSGRDAYTDGLGRKACEDPNKSSSTFHASDPYFTHFLFEDILLTGKEFALISESGLCPVGQIAFLIDMIIGHLGLAHITAVQHESSM